MKSKRRFARRALLSVAKVVMYGVVRALAATYRFREIGLSQLATAKTVGRSRGYLLACWHETVLGMTLAQRGRFYCAITSRSNAGDIVAYIMAKLGFYPARGSQSGGGKEVRDEALEFLERGAPIAITIDGSTGPRRKVKPGVVDLAMKGGAPIVPGYAHCDRMWVLNTWDRMQVPKPFARIIVCYGAPIVVPPDQDGPAFEATLNDVARALAGLEELAKRPFGADRAGDYLLAAANTASSNCLDVKANVAAQTL